MATTRRMGTETSETRFRLLDITERVMIEDGYASVSSRRVAKDAGVTPALVHYYFATIDDLFLEGGDSSSSGTSGSSARASRCGHCGRSAASRRAPPS